jgi:peptidoglycan/LPS O-acetylase OafA/YrhL
VFGVFRLSAALMVLLTHIAGIEFVAGFAVWGFFMLSGFLMTATLQQRYGFSAGGLRQFGLSRMRRLLPTYWASVLIAIPLLVVAGAEARALNPSFGLPSSPVELLSGAFIVGHTFLGIGRVPTAVSPSAWAIDVEIMMYLCSAVFLSRTVRTASFTLAVSCIVFPALWWEARSLLSAGELSLASQLLYSFLPVALIPYSLGALLWFKRDAWRMPVSPAIAITTGCAVLILDTLVIFPRSTTLAYLLTLPCLLIILFGMAKMTVPVALLAFDQFCADVAYPLYLVHWSAALLYVLLLPGDSGGYTLVNGRVVFSVAGAAGAIALALAVASLLTLLVERPLERRRRQWLTDSRCPKS